MRSVRVTATGVVGLLLVLTGGCNGSRGGEVHTIRCITVRAADAYTQAELMADSLKRVPQLADDLVSTRHHEQGSDVLYGRYTRRWDGLRQKVVFRPDPAADLQLIKSLSYDSQTRPFMLAALEPLDDPMAGAAGLDVANATGHWGLQVAVFYDTETFFQRRQAAIDYCRELRDGGYEAYVHHGPAKSSVIVGSFPEAAVAMTQRERQTLTGRTVVAGEVHIVDPALRQLKLRFPYNLENGHKMFTKEADPQTGRVRKVPHRSFVVELPKAGEIGWGQ